MQGPAHQPSSSAQSLNRISLKTLGTDRRKEPQLLPLMTAELQCSRGGLAQAQAFPSHQTP